MTKRLISLFLAFIMAIPIAIIPVSADEISTYVDLVGYGYVTVDGTIDTDLIFDVDSSTRVVFPVEFTGRSGRVEILLESPQPITISHPDTGNTLTYINLGNNLYLYSGTVGMSRTETFEFSGANRIYLHRARYYPEFVSSKSAPTLFSLKTTMLSTAYSNRYTSFNVTYAPEEIGKYIPINAYMYSQGDYYSDVYITLNYTSEQLKGYDRLSLDFLVGDWVLENVTAEYSNTPVDVRLSGFSVSSADTTIYGTEYTYGENRYCLDVDLSGIDFEDGTSFNIYINGHMNVHDNVNQSSPIPQQFHFQVFRSEIMILTDVETPETGLLFKVWRAVENLTSSLLRLFEDNDEIVDDFRDEQGKDETVVDDFIDVIETTPTVNLDDVDDLVSSLDDMEIDSDYTTVLASTLDGDFGTYLVLFPVILAVIGYILYGKR